jgi:hypothetical protein
MNGSKQFLQMKLDNCRVLSLGKNFEKILVSQEVKAREFTPLYFKKIV